MSRKADIDKALKVGLDMHTERGPLVYQEALLEAVNLAYDRGVLAAKKRLAKIPWCQWDEAVDKMLAKERKGKK